MIAAIVAILINFVLILAGSLLLVGIVFSLILGVQMLGFSIAKNMKTSWGQEDKNPRKEYYSR